MVANVDYVFIVMSLNYDFSVNKVLRYVTMTIQGNVKPVVILTKTDLCKHVNYYVEEIKASVIDVDVYAVSAVKGLGLEELQKYMQPGKTIALLGSSGVGKSTLVNVLTGKEIMETKDVREKDSKGRHTTTYRQMFVLESGVTIMDTPGMRELGMKDVTWCIEETFADITDLSSQCKYSNCRHKTEPGCAIKEAIKNGILQEKRLRLYESLCEEGKKSKK